MKRENATKFGELGLEIGRVINHIFRSYLNPVGLLPGVRVNRFGQKRWANPIEILQDSWHGKATLREDSDITRVTAKILDMAREDNATLDKNYHLGLGALGYY